MCDLSTDIMLCGTSNDLLLVHVFVVDVAFVCDVYINFFSRSEVLHGANCEGPPHQFRSFPTSREHRANLVYSGCSLQQVP